MNDLEFIIKICEDILIKAGDKIMDLYFNNHIMIKRDSTFISDIELLSNEIITENLFKYFPNFGIISKKDYEADSVNCDYIWIIDPLDGTKEFINRINEFSINLALIYKERPIIGFVYIPPKRELYFTKDKAYYKHNSMSYSIPIHVSSNKELILSTLVRDLFNDSVYDYSLILKNNFKNIIEAGSAYKGCLIAKGIADAYIRFKPIWEWKVCAIDVIIEKAGGKVTDFNGNKLLYGKKNKKINNFIASNGKIHEKLIDLVTHI